MNKNFTHGDTQNGRPGIRNLLLFIFLFLSVLVHAQLNGSFTIDQSIATSTINFQSFKAATDTLKLRGVNGPVTFTVSSHVYNERVQIDSIPGASPANTITFEGTNAAASVISYNSGTVSANRSTVQIVKSPYVTLKNLTIQTTGTTYGWGVHIMSKSNGCRIKHCIIDIAGAAASSTSTNYCGIIVSGSATAHNTGIRADSLEIDSNHINNGAYGIIHWALTNDIALNNKFRGNTINNSYTAAIHLNFHNNPEIVNNMISIRAGASFSRGIYLSSSNTTGASFTKITGNRITNPGSYGIAIETSSNTGSEKGLIANNSIGGGFQGTGLTYGINIANCNRWNIFHNSVNKDKAGNNGDYAACYISTGNNLTIYNNVFAVTGPGAGLPFYAANASSIDSMDYNSFYSVNTGDLIYAGKAFNGDNFKGGAGFNLHSEFTPAYFFNDTILRPLTACNTGVPISSITHDINGNARNAKPNTGAFEYVSGGISNNLSIDELVSPVKSNVQAGVQDLVIRVKNKGINPIFSFNITYELNNLPPVSTSWSGTLDPCDTVSITFAGINPGNVNRLNVYVSSPNNNPDSYRSDDTLKTLLFTPLSGNYSIGKNGADFTSINEALLLMSSMGVAGPVTFNLETGTYNEPVFVSAVTGASASSTVTFRSAANHPDSVILSNGTAGVIRIRNARYINFKDLTVTTSGWAIELTDTASYDSIINCKINAGMGIAANNFSGMKNVFTYNTLTGNAGFYLRGASLTAFTDSNTISFNTIQVPVTGTHGIELYAARYTLVYANRITAQNYGIHIQYSPFIRVFNNSIIANSTISRGISIVSGNNQRIFHNSVSAANSGAYINYSASADSGNEWYNNIITSSGTANALYIENNNPGLLNKWNYNIYFTNGALPLYNNTFAAWQRAGQDTNSMVNNPGFVSLTDLHLSSGCRSGLALNVVTDKDNNIRNNPPSIGAYEYTGINNIAVDAIAEPLAGNISGGLQDIKVRVKNTGVNSVTSFNISYVLNNGTEVRQLWNAGTLNQCDTISVVLSNVNLLPFNNISIYTDAPNGTTDSYAMNDTLKTVLRTPLNGAYTIGSGAASFASFNEAVTALMYGGVSGPVVFNVQTGTYTEQLTIKRVTGASASNTITFRSVTGNADDVIVSFNVPTGTPVIKLDNASYFHFNKLTVRPSNNTGVAFQLTDSASYDSISFCKINMGTGTAFSEGYSAVYAKLLIGGKNVVHGNIINGGTYGIYLWGVSDMIRSDNNVISDNTITNTASTSANGCNLRYIQNLKFKKNIIHSGGYAAQVQNSYVSLEVSGNKLSSTGVSGGINLSAVYGTSSTPSLIVNNIISGAGGSGINVNNGTHHRFYHNTINNTGASSYGIQVNYSFNDSANTWMNNVISNTGSTATSYAARIQNAPGIMNSWDHNLYYSAATLFFNSATAFETWQSTLQDLHSSVYRASFTAANDLTPNRADTAAWALNGRAAYVDSNAVRTDFNGNSRPLKQEDGLPDLGAVEFTPFATTKAPLTRVTGVIKPDSLQLFFSPFNNDTVASVKWSVSGSAPENIAIRQYVGERPQPTALTDKYMYFYCDIQVTSTNPYVYDARLFYKDQWLGKITQESDLKLTRYESPGPWTFNTSGVFSSTDIVNNVILDQNLSHSGIYTGAEQANQLPVSLLSFTAAEQNKVISLTWTTASEVNVKEFTIERSYGSNTWEYAGTSNSGGNQSRGSSYLFTDKNVAENANKIFYRLRITDLNGAFSYSKTVSVNRSEKNTLSISAYPNPTAKDLFINLAAANEGIAEVSITSITGNIIKSLSGKVNEGPNKLFIPANDLPQGMYFLTVCVNGDKAVTRFIKD